MKVTSTEEIRAIEQQATEKYGIPNIALMQSAGEAFARGCVDELGGSVMDKKIAMVCGRGNNGGDGFVAARYLANLGAKVTVYLAGTPDLLKGDPAEFYKSLEVMELPIQFVDEGDVPDFDGYDLIGDALIGIGVKMAVTGVAAQLIGAMNRSEVPIVAADIPSGVETDNGRLDGVAVQAHRTVTFTAPKYGLLLLPGSLRAGRVTIADIGIPRALTENASLTSEMTTQKWMREILPLRTQGRDANKGAFGKILIIAGSIGMLGAAALTAVATLRSGAGYVTLVVPESAQERAASILPELIIKVLPETSEKTHGGRNAIDIALNMAENVDAVAIGPGMGGGGDGNKPLAVFVQTFASRVNKPIVIDADGLNALEAFPEHLLGRGDMPTVLTPHPAELGRLIDLHVEEVQADRRGAALRCAQRSMATVLLKGARTLIATRAPRLGLNRMGSPVLGTAGSGDVLTGIIATLLGQGLSAFDAARAGAYWHALAGELAEAEIGTVGVTAGDVRDRIPAAHRMLYERDGLDEL